VPSLSESTFFFEKQQQQTNKQTNKQHKQTNNMPHPSIGFIGLGIMGEGMAGRLISRGVAAGSSNEVPPLVVYNRTASKCDDMISRYPNCNIVVKKTAREVVECCS